MWKLFLPGEVPDTNATTARVVSYTAQSRTNLIANSSELPPPSPIWEDVLYETIDTNTIYKYSVPLNTWVAIPYGQETTTYYPDNSGTNPMWKLYFYDYLNQFIAQIGNVYYTNVEVPFNIQEANIHPVLTMTLDGDIVTNQRIIPLVASSTYSAILSDRNSTKNDCSSYRLNTLQSWKLTNNGTSVINWKALYPTISGNPAYPSDEIVGDALAPGEWVGSSNVYGGNKKCIATNSLTYGNGGSAIFSSCV